MKAANFLFLLARMKLNYLNLKTTYIYQQKENSCNNTNIEELIMTYEKVLFLYKFEFFSKG